MIGLRPWLIARSDWLRLLAVVDKSVPPQAAFAAVVIIAAGRAAYVRIQACSASLV